ncbi:unnamed protein product [Paramecium octaurelia]|uniref:Uncharacterized protein n=1 Tax=Paramecium octaurelia TaxID=43137 RepID=A0A8S1S6X7_PAROT|nr:unnamed protein product [Paramecium octaurelia]
MPKDKRQLTDELHNYRGYQTISKVPLFKQMLEIIHNLWHLHNQEVLNSLNPLTSNFKNLSLFLNQEQMIQIYQYKNLQLDYLTESSQHQIQKGLYIPLDFRPCTYNLN